MTQTLTNWLLASAMAAAMCAGSMLDMDDMSHEVAQAQELEQAVAQEQRELRVAKAAAVMCGSENAVATQTADGVQCRTRRGHKTTFYAGAAL